MHCLCSKTRVRPPHRPQELLTWCHRIHGRIYYPVTVEIAGSSPVGTATFERMSKIEKKKKKLQDRIDFLNDEMRMALTKKTSSTKEISLPEHQKKIKDLQDKLNGL